MSTTTLAMAVVVAAEAISVVATRETVAAPEVVAAASNLAYFASCVAKRAHGGALFQEV